ncbi:MAG: DUF418 domain-containing protein [Chryseolinea sp.]
MTTQSVTAAPVSQSERILLIDSLRGFAILGILLMNIPFFALPPWMGFDPTINNEVGTINLSVYMFVSVIMNGTQRALFSMLFGAGVILFIGRKETNMHGLGPADYHVRRQIWLMVISIFDVYILLWNGDILFDYACYGLILFAFRNLPGRKLALTAAICFAFMVARENRDLYQTKSMISQGKEIAAIDTTKTKLNDKQKAALEEMNDMKKRSTAKSKIEKAQEEISVVQGSYGEVYKWRTENYLSHMVDFTYLEAWDVLMFMFLGMAFLKMGVFTDEVPVKVYWWMLVIGLGIGIPLSYLRNTTMLSFNFNFFDLAQHEFVAYHQIERALRSVGLLGFVMLLYKSGVFGWLFSLLRPVGQMALTNYLGQSLLCGFYFNGGYGLGNFGKLERYEIYIVVLVVWVIQTIFCNIWMKFFFYGPAEWVWRSLTYWKKQPFRMT